MDIHNIHSLQGKNFRELKGDEHPQFSQLAAGVSVQNQQCYLDMGIFYGNNVLTGCMNWQNNTVCADKLESGFLGQFFGDIKSTGVKKIDLSFAQLSSITALAQDSEKAGSSSPSGY